MESGVTRSRPRLSYERHGRHGPRVVLVMGFGMRGSVWRPQIQDLAPDHQVLVYDHQGIGKSAVGGIGVRSMAGMARDLLRLLDEVGWTDAHVVGVSMGGMIAIETALRAEKRCRSLTLIATHAGGPSAWVPPIAGLRDFLLSFFHPSGRARLEAVKTLLYPDEYLATCDPQALAERLEGQFGRPAEPTVLVGQMHAVLRFDARTRLRHLEVPTLVIKPELDALVRPSGSDLLASRIRTAELIRVPDAGHGVTFQRAALVNERIRRHVSDVEATSLALRGASIHA